MKNKYNEIYGIDIDSCSADELAEKAGVAQQPDWSLLRGLLECLDSIDLNIAKYDEKDRAYASAAVISYELYRRYYRSNERPLQFRDMKMKCNDPSSLHFWKERMPIECLFHRLIEDGFYRETKQPYLETFYIPDKHEEGS